VPPTVAVASAPVCSTRSLPTLTVASDADSSTSESADEIVIGSAPDWTWIPVPFSRIDEPSPVSAIPSFVTLSEYSPFGLVNVPAKSSPSSPSSPSAPGGPGGPGGPGSPCGPSFANVI
jgi:hypothetical protein